MNTKSRPSPRVLFLGIDSAEPNLIRQWCEDGTLPTLQRLRNDGAWRQSENLPGIGSDATWTSLWTGRRPGEHDRYFYRQLKEGTYRADLYEPSDDKPEPFWAGLSRADRKVAIVDVPYTAVAKDLNGIGDLFLFAVHVNETRYFEFL